MTEKQSTTRSPSVHQELKELSEQIGEIRDLIVRRVDEGLDTRSQSETFFALLRRRKFLRGLDS